MQKKLLSVRVNAETLREVRRSFGAKSDSETMQRALERSLEETRAERFLKRWGGKGAPDSFASIASEHTKRR